MVQIALLNRFVPLITLILCGLAIAAAGYFHLNAYYPAVFPLVLIIAAWGLFELFGLICADAMTAPNLARMYNSPLVMMVCIVCLLMNLVIGIVTGHFVVLAKYAGSAASASDEWTMFPFYLVQVILLLWLVQRTVRLLALRRSK